MISHNLCPYGLKSLVECISRAVLLSQPADIPIFLLEYLAELINFRRCHPEADPKRVSFNYQEIWEKKFLRTKKTSETPITTSAASQVPSQAQIEETLTVLYSNLPSSTDGSVVNQVQHLEDRVKTNETSGKDEKPSASTTYPKPTPPPRVGRQYGKNVPPPFLVVKGERKPAPPPSNVSMKTHRVSSARLPSQQEGKGTSKDVRMPQTCQATLTSIPEKPSASESRLVGKPTKLPSVPVPIVTHKLVVPPIPQRKNRGVVPDKTSSRPPEHKAQGPLKTKAGPKAAPVSRPESANEKPTEIKPTPPSDPAPEKKKVRFIISPEKTREIKPTPPSDPAPEKKKVRFNISPEKTKEIKPTPPRDSAPEKKKIRPNISREKTRKIKPTPPSDPAPEKKICPSISPEKTREIKPTPPSDPAPEKKKIRPNISPEKTRVLRRLPQRTRVKPEEDRYPGDDLDKISWRLLAFFTDALC
ncbi:hypothetical protein PAMP_000767 [Pampus punctatissimus]